METHANDKAELPMVKAHMLNEDDFAISTPEVEMQEDNVTVVSLPAIGCRRNKWTRS